MENEDVLKVELEVLLREHRQLDEEIDTLNEGALGNTLMLKRLKRKKLMLKDQIARIEDRLTPDIIA